MFVLRLIAEFLCRFAPAVLLFITSALLSCNNNQFASGTKSSDKKYLTGSDDQVACGQDLTWKCDKKRASCSSTKPVPGDGSWDCSMTSKGYHCIGSGLADAAATCDEDNWQCSEAAAGGSECYLKSTLNPDNSARESKHWQCQSESDSDQILCSRTDDVSRTDAKASDSADESSQKSSASHTDPSIAEKMNTGNQGSDEIKEQCKNFEMSGKWTGTWTATSIFGGSGTWSVMFTQTPDRKISGPFTVTGTPCEGGTGTISGSIGENCNLEFSTELGNGSVDSDPTGLCKFSWKGTINPATRNGAGTWSALPGISGTWKGAKE